MNRVTQNNKIFALYIHKSNSKSLKINLNQRKSTSKKIKMSFSEESLIKKFQDLNNTQQSVQTLSLWLIHHRKHAKTIANIWLKELLNELKPERKLTFIYLANDILQNSRKKGTEYQIEFTTNILLEAIQSTSLAADSKLRFTLERILNIWKDRKIFPDNRIEQFKSALHNPDKVTIDNIDDNILRSPVNNNNNNNQTNNNKSTKKSPKIASSDDEEDVIKKKRKLIAAEHQLTSNKSTVSFDFESKIDLKIPDALELVAMLRDLEKSASSDAIVRGKIAELPRQISDLSILNEFKSQSEIIDFKRKVSESLVLLDEYNQRLTDELIQLKRTTFQLSAFIKDQQRQFDADKQSLIDWKSKVKQVENFKNELKTHLKSLPDLKIIDEAAELSPLPTANDLFSN
jgi:regulator of Ty1 transposition protein 103